MLPSSLSEINSDWFYYFKIIIFFIVFTCLILLFHSLFKKFLVKTRIINFCFLIFFMIAYFFQNQGLYKFTSFIFYTVLIILFQFIITKCFAFIKNSIQKFKLILFKTPKPKFNKFGTPHILTSFGLKVRSKSEVFIAEKLYEQKITFFYEKPLTADGKTYYPDFTIYHGKKTYYWEHFGLLSDKTYYQKTEIKLKWYKKNFPNKLVWTKESPQLLLEIEKELEKITKTKPQNRYRRFLSRQPHGKKEHESQTRHI
ncbi:hypothetical protein Spiro2_001289 [Spirobacillus cienkowskii]